MVFSLPSVIAGGAVSFQLLWVANELIDSSQAASVPFGFATNHPHERNADHDENCRGRNEDH